jgi:hypothetical protein
MIPPLLSWRLGSAHDRVAILHDDSRALEARS